MKGGEEDIVLCPSLMLPFFTLLFENSKISRLVDNGENMIAKSIAKLKLRGMVCVCTCSLLV